MMVYGTVPRNIDDDDDDALSVSSFRVFANVFGVFDLSFVRFWTIIRVEDLFITRFTRTLMWYEPTRAFFDDSKTVNGRYRMPVCLWLRRDDSEILLVAVKTPSHCRAKIARV